MIRAGRGALTVLAAIALLGAARAQDDFTGRAAPVERADAVGVQLQGWRVTVRLHGVLEPVEPAYRKVARKYVSRRVQAGRVRVVVRGTAARGIVYGDLYPAGRTQSLNAELIERGLGRFARAFAAARTDLAEREAGAQRARRGLWSGGDATEVALPAPTVAALRAKPVASPAPTPRPTPRPRRMLPPARRNGAASAGALGLLVGSATLFGLAGAVGAPARRARRRPTLLIDAGAGINRTYGAARPIEGLVSSRVGKVPGVFVRETTWRYNGRSWRLAYEHSDGVAFRLDDGSGHALVVGSVIQYHPLRIARFYNDVPVPRWHDRPYPDDTRTEVAYIPAGAPVSVIGYYFPDETRFDRGPGVARTLVIEGDIRRIVARAGRIAAGLAALGAGLAAGAVALALRVG